MLALALAVVLPPGLLEVYKRFVGPVEFDTQLAVGVVLAVTMGCALYLAYRSSARNEP